jgi:hypothetical protein
MTQPSHHQLVFFRQIAIVSLIACLALTLWEYWQRGAVDFASMRWTVPVIGGCLVTFAPFRTMEEGRNARR